MGSMSEHLPSERSDPANSADQQEPRQPSLRQAPIEPLSDDGVRAFVIGTALFALVFLLALLMPQLAPERWWLTVTPTGTAIGVIGTGNCVWRRNQRTKDAAKVIAPPTA